MWIILELITCTYARVKGHSKTGHSENKTRGRKVELVSRAVAKTLVYSNDRGLLFGRIPSLIRFTSSAPSLSSVSPIPSNGRFSSFSSSSYQLFLHRVYFCVTLFFTWFTIISSIPRRVIASMMLH